ncbi:hypothetical protein SprV_0702454800 [Sparganum proliferum]
MRRLIRIPGILFGIPGRAPTPPHQPTASRQAPELGARCISSPIAGGRRRGPQRVVPTAEDEIQAVLQSPGVVQYLQQWRLLARTLTCRCRRTVQMQVLRQHTDGYAFRCGHCKRKRCVRTGSMVVGSKLSLQTLLRICYKFVEVNVTVTAGRWENWRFGRSEQWGLDKIANGGAGRRREVIVCRCLLSLRRPTAKKGC